MLSQGGATNCLNRIFLSLHKGPLLTGGVPCVEHGMAESKFRVVSHIFYDKCDTLSLRFQLICILRPPIPEVNDDVAAVCKFNDVGNVKLESF